MKSMGMDTMISISRPDLKLMYLVYPGLNSYAEMPAHGILGQRQPGRLQGGNHRTGQGNRGRP